MRQTYSTYEAKAHFSELLRKVRAGQSVLVSHRGVVVAELRPVAKDSETPEARLADLEARGAIVPAKRPNRGARADGARLKPVTKSPGALDRFLADRNS